MTQGPRGPVYNNLKMLLSFKMQLGKTGTYSAYHCQEVRCIRKTGDTCYANCALCPYLSTNINNRNFWYISVPRCYREWYKVVA